MMLDLGISVASGAIFSPCKSYRYLLWRRWSDGPRCVFVMLNPSTADETKDDPTIRRCIGFAKREGCGALTVLNIFAFRATDPKVMRAAADPVGQENDFHIHEATGPGSLVIAAWGTHGAFMGRGPAVAARFGGGWKCLGKTADGSPRHPLYVKGDARLIPLRAAE